MHNLIFFSVSHHVQDSTKKSAIFSRLDKKQDSSSPLTKIKVTLDDSKIARSVNTVRNSHPDDQMESSRNLLKRPAPNSGKYLFCKGNKISREYRIILQLKFVFLLSTNMTLTDMQKSYYKVVSPWSQRSTICYRYVDSY